MSSSSNCIVTIAPIMVSLLVRHEKTKAHSNYTAKMIGVLTEDSGTSTDPKARALPLRREESRERI